MAIVVVGGSNRGVGKTALVCGLIAALPEYGWNAVKITTHEHGRAHGQGMPIWEETRPGEETDTARFLAAGARRAFLATIAAHDRTAEEDLPVLLDALWPNFGRGTNLIFESNSVVHHVRADVCLMIHGAHRKVLEPLQRKPSFTAAVPFADAMVTTGDADDVNLDGLCLPGQEPKPVFHLAALGRISTELLEWLRLQLPPARRL